MNPSRRRVLQLAIVGLGSSVADGILESRGDDLVSRTGSEIEKNGEPISLEANGPILNQTYEMFDPSLKSHLKSIPILKTRLAQTAFSHTSAYLGSMGDFTYVGVSSDWDNKAADSIFWKTDYSKPPYNKKPEDPVFSDSFKLDLLTHEFLHMVEDHLGLDVGKLYQAVKSWYQDELYGRPSVAGVHGGKFTGTNRAKYALWHQLYGQPGNLEDATDNVWKAMKYNDRYKNSPPGTDEFAYIGGTILIPSESRRDRLLEFSDVIIGFYRGIINPKILDLRISEPPPQ
jgi:hypothetical protein